MPPLFILTHVAPYASGPAGVHGVLPQAVVALTQLGSLLGLDPEAKDLATLRPAELAQGGILALFTIGETPFSSEQREAILEGWDSGRLRVFGVHSSSDACRGWDRYVELIGARFAGHPWTQDFAVDVIDASHPATAHLPSPWPWHDELYLFDDFQSTARVLLALADGSLDMTVPEAGVPDCGFPLSWCVENGPRRSFYSALGHFPFAWENPVYLRHLQGGLSWLCEGWTEGELTQSAN